jgi:hypothetical protein
MAELQQHTAEGQALFAEYCSAEKLQSAVRAAPTPVQLPQAVEDQVRQLCRDHPTRDCGPGQIEETVRVVRNMYEHYPYLQQAPIIASGPSESSRLRGGHLHLALTFRFIQLGATSFAAAAGLAAGVLGLEGALTLDVLPHVRCNFKPDPQKLPKRPAVAGNKNVQRAARSSSSTTEQQQQ